MTFSVERKWLPDKNSAKFSLNNFDKIVYDLRCGKMQMKLLPKMQFIY